MFVIDGLADRNVYCHIFVIPEVQDDFNFISHMEVLFETNQHHVIPIRYKYKFFVCVDWYHIYNLCPVLKLRYL